MVKTKTLQQLFERHRRSGDLVFAVFFLVITLFLLSQLGEQTKWVKRTKLAAQPSFWPSVALYGMAFFAVLHFVGSLLSPRIYGRLAEVKLWFSALEFAAWFMAYVWVVPRLGYLPTTLVFMPLLTWRMGFRDKKTLWSMEGLGFLIVLLFKSFLEVKIPGGAVYEYLPSGIRSFMLVNF